MEELVNDTMSSMENEGDQDEMDLEVNVIVDQILEGKILQATSVPVSISSKQQTSVAAPKAELEDDDGDLRIMQAKLQALK